MPGHMLMLAYPMTIMSGHMAASLKTVCVAKGYHVLIHTHDHTAAQHVACLNGASSIV